MGMTAAVKNLFGAIPGAMKPEYHFRFPNAADFAKMLTDLSCFFRPRLHLVDAVVAMEGNGPTSGKNPGSWGLLLGKRGSLRPGRGPAPKSSAARRCPPWRLPGLLAGCRKFTITGGDPAAFRLADFVLPPLGSTLFRSVLPGKAGEAFGRIAQAALSPPSHAHRGKPAWAAASARPSARPRPSPWYGGKAQNPPQDLHPLLLLPGILPQGRIESPAHQVGAAAEPVIRGTQASPWCPRGGVRPKGSDGGGSETTVHREPYGNAGAGQPLSRALRASSPSQGSLLTPTIFNHPVTKGDLIHVQLCLGAVV